MYILYARLRGHWSVGSKLWEAFAEKFVTKFTRVDGSSSSPSFSSYYRRMCISWLPFLKLTVYHSGMLFFRDKYQITPQIIQHVALFLFHAYLRLWLSQFKARSSPCLSRVGGRGSMVRSYSSGLWTLISGPWVAGLPFSFLDAPWDAVLKVNVWGVAHVKPGSPSLCGKCGSMALQ